LSAREEGCSTNRDGEKPTSHVVTFLDAQERIIMEDKEEGELSDSQISGPDCEESCLSARMFAGSNSKRVPLSPLPSNSLFNQGWVSWRDASGSAGDQTLKMRAKTPLLQIRKMS
jgi:hypothetical protein